MKTTVTYHVSSDTITVLPIDMVPAYASLTFLSTLSLGISGEVKANPKFSQCCNQGKMIFDPIPLPPKVVGSVHWRK
jgi:hypothetical protein